MLNPDQSARGATDGLKDARKKNPKKNFVRMGVNLTTFVRGTPAFESYIKAYNDTFDTYLKTQSAIAAIQDNQTKRPSKQDTNYNSSSNNQKSKSMSSRGLELQIELLKEVEQHLKVQIDSLNQFNQIQNNFLRQMDNEQLDVKMLMAFEEQFQSCKSKVDALIDEIDSHTIAEARRIRRYLEETPI